MNFLFRLMRSKYRRTLAVWTELSVLFLGCLLSTGLARSEELRVIHFAPMNGELAHYAKDLRNGMQAYFNHVNGSGGVNGNTIRLISIDDSGSEPEVIQKIEQTAAEFKPITFMYLVGPATIEATNKSDIFARIKIPLIGTTPAAFQLREPTRPYVFHLTQGEDQEHKKLVQHLRTVGFRKVALIHWDDIGTLGEVKQFEAAAALPTSIDIVERAIVSAGSGQLDGPFRQISQVKADAIISMLPVEETAKLLTLLRSRGQLTPIYGASYTESGAMFDNAGEAASRGVTVTQIVPNPFSGTLPVVREYKSLMAKLSNESTRLGTISLEGFLAAKLLVEALKRTSNSVTPFALREALEKRGPFDLGGLKASFGPSDHVGLDFIDIAVVTYGGRLRY